jgi:hypothetical protein
MQLYFQNQKLKRIAESKQDGLLMLESSNSQSCKEFTLEGEFYLLYTMGLALQRFTRTLPSRDYIDVYRCMVKHANCFTLNKSRPNP